MEELSNSDTDNFRGSGRRPPNNNPTNDNNEPDMMFKYRNNLYDDKNNDDHDDEVSEAPSMTPSMAEEASMIGSLSGLPTDEELGIGNYRASQRQHRSLRSERTTDREEDRFQDEGGDEDDDDDRTLEDIHEEEEDEGDYDEEYFDDYNHHRSVRGSSRGGAGAAAGGYDAGDHSYRSSSRRGSSGNSYRGSSRHSHRGGGSQERFSLFESSQNNEQYQMDDHSDSQDDESQPETLLPGIRASKRQQQWDDQRQESYRSNNPPEQQQQSKKPQDDEENEHKWFFAAIVIGCCCLLIIVVIIVLAVLVLGGGNDDDGNDDNDLPANRTRPTPRPSAAPTPAPTVSSRPSLAPVTPTTAAPATPAPSVAPTARMLQLYCWQRTLTTDWARHFSVAQSFQGHLATIPSSNVQNLVQLAMTNGPGGANPNTQAWIGLNDNDNEGDFVWAGTGDELDLNSQFAQEAFRIGEPDNGGGIFSSLQNCVQIDGTGLPGDSGFFAWRDADCFDSVSAIYQLPTLGKYHPVGQSQPTLESTQCAIEAWTLGNLGPCVDEAGTVLPPCSGADVVDVNQDRIFCRNDGLSDWTFHSRVAERYGGSLVRVDDEATNNLVKILASAGSAPSWIGLNANPSGAGWVWAWGSNPTGDGSVFTVGSGGFFDDFAVNQPSEGPGEGCVSLSTADGYQWNDDVCNALHKAIYQLPRLATCHVLLAGGGFDCIDGQGNALTEANSFCI